MRANSDKILEAVNIVENIGVKIEAILKKLEKLDVIKLQLNEVHLKVASIKESVSRLDLGVQVLKTRTTNLEKITEELEEESQYNKDLGLLLP